MKYLLYATILLFFSPQEDYISRLRYYQQGDNLIIKYDLKTISDNQYYEITLNAYDGNQKLLKSNNLSGDIGEVNRGGNKEIFWNNAVEESRLKEGEIMIELDAILFQHIEKREKNKPKKRSKKKEAIINNNFVLVEGGMFTIGDKFGIGENDEKPIHQVFLNDFYIDQYEVTFALYDLFCKETKREKPFDNGWGRGQRPVINVSWYDAIAFCNWRSYKDGYFPSYEINENIVICNWEATGYRLPTEAEWEVAAQGGHQSKNFVYAGNSNIDEMGIYSGIANYMTSTVGSKRPNELEIYDMSGNVWEWCWDWYDNNYYQRKEANNPKGLFNGNYRTLKGGCWNDLPVDCRIANRFRYVPNYSSYDFGFRCVRNY